MRLRYRCLLFAVVLAAPARAQWQPLGPANTYDHSALAAASGVVLVGVSRTTPPLGIYRSGDGGATWTNPVTTTVDALARIEGAFIAARGANMQRSDPAGQTWTNAPGIGQGSVRQLFYDRRARRLYAATGNRGFWHIWRSLDQGQTWTSIDVAGQPESTTFVHARGDTLITGYNGTNGRMLVSLDGGQTWTRANLGTISYPAGAFIDSDGTMYAVGATAGLFGNTNKVERSRDGGQTWTDITATIPSPKPPAVPLEMRAVVYAEGPRILFSSGRALYFSTDGGATWTSRSEGLPATGSGSVSAMAADGGYLYVLQQQYVPGQSTGYGAYRRPLADFGFTGTLVAVPPDERSGIAALAVHPNPARADAVVTLTLRAPAWVRVAVHDALGRAVAVLHDGSLAAGPHRFGWDGAAPPGVYLVRLVTPGGVTTRALVRAR